MSLRRSFAAFAVACALAFASPAVAATPWGLAPGDFYSELSGSFYSSKDFFNDNKKRQQFDGTLEERVVRSHNEFGWRKWATLTLDLPFVSRTFVPAGYPQYSSTSTGFGDIGLGLRVPLHVAKTPLAFSLDVELPMGTNRALFPGTSGEGGLNGESLFLRNFYFLQDTSAFFSQGLTTATIGLDIGGAAGSRAYWAAGAGYRTKFFSIAGRDSLDRYADFVTASASLGLWVTNNVLVAGEFAGEWQSDQGKAYDRIALASGDELESVRMIAGPRITYRVDERMDVFAGSWHTPMGRNVVHHDLFYVGIAWKHSGLDRLAGALGGTKAR